MDKKIVLLLMFTLIIFVNLAGVSAWEWDNFKNYDSETKTATITNALGFGNKIAELTLDTPLHNKVGFGYQKVAQITIQNYAGYHNALKKMQFYNIKKGMKKFERDFDYKYLIKVPYEVNIYDGSCGRNLKGDCTEKVIGKEIRYRDEWKNIGKDLPKGKVTIGIFTNVEQGDYVEWIPTWFGVEINEWASWEAGLSSQLDAYWNLTSRYVVKGNVDLTEEASPNWDASGLLNGCVNMSSGCNELRHDTLFDTMPSALTVNFWFNPTVTWNAENTPGLLINKGDADNSFAFGGHGCAGGQIGVRTEVGGADFLYLCSVQTTWTAGTWYMLTFTWDTTKGKQLWIDGVNEANDSTATTLMAGTSGGEFCIGSESNLGDCGNTYCDQQAFDEFGIWNRSLTASEIGTLYNSGSGITYEPIEIPSVSILYPTAIAYSYSVSNINYSSTGTPDPDRCWYSTDYGLTNSTPTVAAGTNFTGLTPATEGSSIWTVYCNSTAGVGNSTVTFSVDTTPPTINITSPNSTIKYHISGTNIFLNWSIAEGNLDSCWYEYDGANYTIANERCTISNYTSFNITDSSIASLIFFANDSLGNVGEVISTWDYKVFQHSVSYSSSILETASQTITLYASGRDGYDLSADLIYNGTLETTTRTTLGTLNYSFSSTFQSPAVSISSETKNFHFNFTETNEANGTATAIQSDNYHQIIKEIQFGLCNQELNVTLLNFTLYDEETGNVINGVTNKTTFQATFTFGADISQKTSNYSINNVSVTNSSFAFCTNNDTYTIYTDMEAFFAAVDYSERDYMLSDATLTNDTNDINLYLLLEDNSLEFFFTVYQDLKPLTSTTVQLSKYFIGEGAYKNIEIDETDALGEFTAYLDLDKNYKAIIIKDGVVLDSIEFKATCAAAPCEIILDIGSTSADLFAILNSSFAENVVYSLSFDAATKVVTFDFIDTTGLADYFRMVVYNSNSSQGATQIYNNVLYTSSGSLTFNATGYSGDFRADTYVSRSPEKFINFITWIIDFGAEILGVDGLLAAFMLIMVIIFGLSFKPSILIMGIPVILHLGRIMGLISLGPTFILMAYILGGLGVVAMRN